MTNPHKSFRNVDLDREPGASSDPEMEREESVKDLGERASERATATKDFLEDKVESFATAVKDKVESLVGDTSASDIARSGGAAVKRGATSAYRGVKRFAKRHPVAFVAIAFTVGAGITLLTHYALSRRDDEEAS